MSPFAGHVITCSHWYQSQSMLVKKAPCINFNIKTSFRIVSFASITWSNATWYCIQHFVTELKHKIRAWSHNGHHKLYLYYSYQVVKRCVYFDIYGEKILPCYDGTTVFPIIKVKWSWDCPTFKFEIPILASIKHMDNLMCQLPYPHRISQSAVLRVFIIFSSDGKVVCKTTIQTEMLNGDEISRCCSCNNILPLWTICKLLKWWDVGIKWR